MFLALAILNGRICESKQEELYTNPSSGLFLAVGASPSTYFCVVAGDFRDRNADRRNKFVKDLQIIEKKKEKLKEKSG